MDELVLAMDRGHEPTFLHFWGHRARGGQPLGKECLSQWWPTAFEVDGVGFASAEHYMMWSKATLFGDDTVASQVLAADTAAQAKGLGRLVEGFDEAVWERRRWDIVVQGSVAKFAADSQLWAFLASTDGRVLVEAAPNDRVWGIGLAVGDPASHDPRRWQGLNLLGFALMEARARLTTQEPKL